jgi:hypothetical protein
MTPFNEADVHAAFDELRPHVQRLVDRFGQAQAFEITIKVAHAVCPDGEDKAPQYYILGDEAAVN